MSEGDKSASEAGKSLIDEGIAFVTEDQAAEVAEPGKGTLNFPAAAVTAQFAAILRGLYLAALPLLETTNPALSHPRYPFTSQYFLTSYLGQPLYL